MNVEFGSPLSFVGGSALLPATIPAPSCRLCRADQAFLLQLHLRGAGAWSNRIIAVFSCVSCVEQSGIPAMIEGALPGATIEAAFLSDYQDNFRIVVFDAADDPLETASAWVVRATLTAAGQVRPPHHRAVGYETTKPLRIRQTPKWLLEDESPAAVAGGTPFEFLFQWDDGVRFVTTDDAPRQQKMDIFALPRTMPSGRLTVPSEPASEAVFELFNSNYCYFFGAEDGAGRPLVYVLTQT